jgi:hypothetical protein
MSAALVDADTGARSALAFAVSETHIVSQKELSVEIVDVTKHPPSS